MSSIADRYEASVRRLMALSGERRVGPQGLFGETVSLPRRAGRFMLWTAGAVGLLGIVAWVLFSDQPCLGVLYDIEFAGTENRFDERFEQRFANQVSSVGCDLETVRNLIVRDIGFSVFYAVLAGVVLTVWWNASWDTEPGFSRLRGDTFAMIAAGLLVVELMENLATLSQLGMVESENLTVGSGVWFIFTVAWVKWMLIAILAAAAIAIFLSWSVRLTALTYQRLRSSHEADHNPPVVTWHAEEHEPKLGICLSGGGIRSAAFSLGALSALEETEIEGPRSGRPPGVLGRADLLASVSGGGYAASAWRTAIGLGSDAVLHRTIIGDPNAYSAGESSTVSVPPTVLGQTADRQADRDLFPKLRDYRDFLRNGRGGMMLSAVIVVVQMLWHLLLTLALLVLVAWPIGRLVQSWIITTPESYNSQDPSIDYGRLAIPSIGLLIVMAIVLIARSFTNRGKPRNLLNAAAMALVGLSGLLAVVLLALPLLVTWMVDLDVSRLNESALATLLGSSIVISALRMLRAPIQSRALYLGGVLLLIGLLWFALVVAAQAAEGSGVFALGWRWWVAGVGFYVAVLLVSNPDLWSLHWIYRRRLAQTFANHWNPETQTWDSLPTGDQPPLSSYLGAPGPKQVICAVAARGERTNTGIRALSMTFEPDYITVHCGPDPSRAGLSPSYAIATDHYEQLFHGRTFGDRYRTVFAATALSAAAVAPSLGRMNLGSTNALIAALNLRLGSWMPNPLYRRGRRASPDLVNMFKELLGSYDLSDPNIYVTDGGHWENLALVELIRRRTRRIISVDASGDKGFSFSAVLEAVELAQLECAATITFLDGGLDDMRPGDRPRAKRNWCRAEIRYVDGTLGKLLYVKAQASDEMPLDVLRYSKEDPTFPNYSTADQLLKESEFCNLAILGRESMIGAMEDSHQWLFEPLPVPSPASVGRSAAGSVTAPPGPGPSSGKPLVKVVRIPSRRGR